MRFRIFTEPQEGATYDDQLAVALLAEELGLRRLLPLRPLHRLLRPARPPRSHRRVDHARRPRPRHDAPAARHAGLAGHVPPPRPARDQRRPGRRDERRPGRARARRGMERPRARRRTASRSPTTGERFDRLEEQLAIITGLWTTPVGESFSFDGEHYPLADSPALPKPVQRPHPPIVIGGFGAKRTPRLAARLRHGVQRRVRAAGRVPRRSSSACRAACEAIGPRPRDARRSASPTRWCAARDDAEVARRAAAIGRTPRPARRRDSRARRRRSSTRIGLYRDGGAETDLLPGARPARPRPPAAARRRRSSPRSPELTSGASSTSLNEWRVGRADRDARSTPPARTCRQRPSSPAPSAHAIAALIGDTWLTTTTSCSRDLLEQLVARRPHPHAERGQRLAAGRARTCGSARHSAHRSAGTSRERHAVELAVVELDPPFVDLAPAGRTRRRSRGCAATGSRSRARPPGSGPPAPPPAPARAPTAAGRRARGAARRRSPSVWPCRTRRSIRGRLPGPTATRRRPFVATARFVRPSSRAPRLVLLVCALALLASVVLGRRRRAPGTRPGPARPGVARARVPRLRRRAGTR